MLTWILQLFYPVFLFEFRAIRHKLSEQDKIENNK